ncbi:MAG: hypothetical protein E3J28_05490 [Desulfobacteraceae bacterium]|nr:MAG: hypothetical protein DRG66_08225 [Deltaproteobacteria bacterium]TET92723.1 MAG: hypothetical protein E3J28_05490 [Desulfobacteraceae bacterium]
MKKLAIISIVIFLSLFFIIPLEVSAQNAVETFENGKIDWTTGVASAIGIGAPPKKPINMAQARAMAKRAAVIVARRNLLEIIKGVRIDSTTLIKDFVVQSDIIRNQVDGYLERSQVVDIAYMSDGSVEATVAMNLRGGFANLMLPKSIKSIPPIRQAQAPTGKQGEAYTGLVVDSRGFQVKPAMSLKIVDEDGNEVYGSSYVSRDYAINQGMAGYAKDITAAQTNDRVTNNPLTVKGVRTADTGDSDIIISNADAARIKGAAENLEFLQKCRVMVVLD